MRGLRFFSNSLDPGAWIQEPGSRTLDPGAWIQEPGSRSLDLGSLDPGLEITDALFEYFWKHVKQQIRYLSSFGSMSNSRCAI